MTAGSNYFGPYTSSPPLTYSNVDGLVISGLSITNPSGNAILLSNCTNVIIENCYLYSSLNQGVQIEGGSNITVRNTMMQDVATGVYANNPSGGGIQVLNCEVKNVQGPFARGQLAQFNAVNGADCKINYNIYENFENQSEAEDHINLFSCNGTAVSPIEVKGNRGRHYTHSASGGGIMTGDSGGSYQTVSDNIIVDEGTLGYGIGIASGTDIIINNNIIYGRNKDTNSYVPIFINNLYSGNGESCNNNTVSNNIMDWRNASDVKRGIGYANYPACGDITGYNGTNTNQEAATIDPSTYADSFFTYPEFFDNPLTFYQTLGANNNNTVIEKAYSGTEEIDRIYDGINISYESLI